MMPAGGMLSHTKLFSSEPKLSTILHEAHHPWAVRHGRVAAQAVLLEAGRGADVTTLADHWT